ncbi:MAG: hypothetical protein D6820_10470 [Lentisphaerae bacterium]|nr:MAG: hypothetical protein D6820_10470 [Lentisphaerota bacterium]
MKFDENSVRDQEVSASPEDRDGEWAQETNHGRGWATLRACTRNASNCLTSFRSMTKLVVLGTR